MEEITYLQIAQELKEKLDILMSWENPLSKSFEGWWIEDFKDILLKAKFNLNGLGCGKKFYDTKTNSYYWCLTYLCPDCQQAKAIYEEILKK